MWRTCFILFCFLLTVFCANYTYYDGKIKYQIFFFCKIIFIFRKGFAYINSNQTISNISAINQTLTNQTVNYCVCQCLLTNGCSALTFYNASSTCSLVNDSNITEGEVNFNTMAKLVLINAVVSPSP